MAALHGPDLADLSQLLLQLGNPGANVAAVRLQLGLAGASGANATALPGQADSHAGQARQKILVLSQLHLQPAFCGLGPLGKNVQNQGASVQDRDSQKLLQHPNLGGRQRVVKNGHARFRGLDQLTDLLGLAGADQGAGVRSVAVLKDLGGAEATCRLQQSLQLLQTGLRGGLLLGKTVGVQPHQDRPLDGVFLRHIIT